MPTPYNPDVLEQLIKYARTDTQKTRLRELIEHGTTRKAAEAAGVTQTQYVKVIKAVKKLAALQGFSPEEDESGTIPEPLIARGKSILYDADGKPKMTWVKSQLSRESFDELLQEYSDLFFAELPKVTPVEFKHKEYDTDIIPWFQIGDAHLGMLAHKEEVGHNFDLKIATRDLMAAWAILVDECPTRERCVINDLGDFTHYENFSGTTEASGHALDYDSRFHRMIKVYIPLMRWMVERCLTKFKYVDVIINQGNHSRTNDIWMCNLLKNVYRDEPRIHVLDNASVFIPYVMGSTFVMTHHSDKCRPNKLAAVMATDYAKQWGQCKNRYIDVGHVHHGFVTKEHPGVLIESWNHLAAPDKYAHEGGWRSRQSITRVDRSRRYGNVGRRVLSIEEVEGRIKCGNMQDYNDIVKKETNGVIIV